MMASINFLFGNRTPSGFSIAGAVSLGADVTVRESHERLADVTQHPVETGATIADHIVLQPERVTLEGFVTDSPTVAFASAQRGRTQDAFFTLDRLYREREPVSVVTGYRVYESMVIVRLDMPRERPASMQFTIELQHVRVVESATAPLPDVAESADEGAAASGERTAGDTRDLASPQQDAGRQAAREASAPTAERATSILRDLTRGAP